jgi:uncharacterized membrane protein
MQYWMLLVLDIFVVGIPMFYRLARPIEINALYGYRTKRSRKNKHTWKAANKYSSNLMVFGSAMVIFFQLTLVMLEKDVSTVIILSCIFWILTLIVGVFMTESYLKSRFDNDGNAID